MSNQKLHSSQRRDLILTTLQREKLITAPAMAELCGASEMTIRRDFDFLAELGLLARTHGGAVLPDSLSGKRFDMVEPSLDRRTALNHEAKLAIAALAAEQVEPDQTIALDVGSTVFALADRIRDMQVRVFTASLMIASHLGQARARVYLPGGEVQGTEPSLVGARTVENLKRFYFDTVFLGVSGISADGIFDYSLEETEIKSAMIARSKRAVVLADSSKFDRVSVARVSELSGIDLVITEQAPPKSLSDALEAAGVETLVASSVFTKMKKGNSNGF
jgi:DeoR family glycerol-3-phosphate regulon repressor